MFYYDDYIIHWYLYIFHKLSKELKWAYKVESQSFLIERLIGKRWSFKVRFMQI